jgi:hypothetical protein
MRPRAAHPIDGAGTAEGALSRPWRSPTGVCAWPPRCGALVRLLAPRGHHSAPPFPVWQGQQRTDKILSASSPCKSPAVVCLAACLRPRVRACIVRARSSTSRRPVGPGAHPYKRDPPPSLPFGRAPSLPPSLTLVSRLYHTLPLFPPCCQCRVTLPAFHPHVQVPELPSTSVTPPPQPPPACARLYSDEDRASPPVSTALSMPSLFGSSWASKPCCAGSL